MATTNFTFTTFTGSETAGWNSINTIINSIDAQLYAKASGIASGGSSGQVLTWSGTSWVAGTVGASGIDNNAVALGTKTTGDYVASVAAAGSGEVVVTGSGESAAATVRLADNTALRGAATVATPPTYTAASTGTVGRIPDAKYVTDALSYATTGGVTLSGDVTGATNANSIGTGAVIEGKIAASAVTEGKIATGAVTEDKIAAGAVTYAKLASNAKTYSVATTATTGVYYTSTDYLTSASVSTVSGQNPLVIANNASTPFSLWLPNNIGSAGSTITICQLGAASVTILPYVAGGSLPSINGSTSTTYVLGGQYSIVTLVCLANTGSGSSTWIITGDYI